MNLPLLFIVMILPLQAIIPGSSNDTLPFTFKAGDTARAASVNDNFKYLLESIKKSEARIAKVEARMDSLEEVSAMQSDSITKTKNTVHLPIGTIVGSMLNPTEFANSLGADSVEWRLADGTPGTNEYKIAIEYNLPDLRGVFLRGINNGKEGDTAFIDPEGNRKAGSFQGDMLKSHNHSLKQYLYDPSADSGVWNVFDNTNRTYNISGVDYTGGVETRPKNVAVYWYVKVK